MIRNNIRLSPISLKAEIAENDSLTEIYEFLDDNDIAGLYDYLGVDITVAGSDTLFTDSVVTVGIGCDRIEIPILICEENTCDDVDFEGYFENFWADSLDVLGDDGTYLKYFPNTYGTGVEPGEFNTLIGNMLGDGYDCDELWQCWIASTRNYAWTMNFLDTTSEVGIKYDLLDEFLTCTGRKLAHWSSNRTGSDGYITNAYKYFKYTPGDNLSCEASVCEADPMYCNVDHEINATNWDPGQDTLNGDPRYKYWEQLYSCIYNYDDVHGLSQENYANMGINSCQTACDDRYLEFKDGLMARYRDDSIYVEGDIFELTRDSTFGGIFLSVGDSLTTAINPTYLVSMDKIECTTMSLVEHCKSYCELTDSLPDSLGTTAQRLKVMKAMTWNFEIDFPVMGSCGGWDLISNATSYDTLNTGGSPVLDMLYKEQWDRRWGGSSADMVVSFIKTSDGGLLLNGGSTSSASYDVTETGNGLRDIWVVKISKEGNKLWDRLIGGSSYDEVTTMIETSEGAFILGGTSQSNASGDKSQNSRGDEDYWVIKIDKFGNKLWEFTYGGNHSDALWEVIERKEGGYLLAGNSASGLSGEKTDGLIGSTDIWLVQIDKDGAFVKDTTIGYSGVSLKLNHAIQLHDSSYVLTGNSSSFATEGFVYKLSRNYSTLWTKVAGGNYDGDAIRAFEEQDGDLVVLVGTATTGGDVTHSMYGYGDMLLLKLNSSGGKVWDRVFGGDDEEMYGVTHISTDLMQTDKEEYIIAVQSFSNASGVKTENNYGNGNIWLVKVDGNGTKLWDRTFGGDDAEQYPRVVYDHKGANEIIYFSAYSTSNAHGTKSQDNLGGGDYWVTKIQTACIGDSVCFRFVEPTTFPDSVYTKITPISCDSASGLVIKDGIRSQIANIIERELSSFEAAYNNTCANPDSINDQFIISYDAGYFHYTLYYYDRAGNLVRTVPPKGVDITNSNRLTHPSHTYVTEYDYNSLNQLVRQETPDGGESTFCYDGKARLRFSQNAQQAIDNTYSYTKYDALGRIVEVGQSTKNESIRCDSVDVSTFPTNTSSSNKQRTYTVYTTAANNITYLDGSPQTFLQNRVSYTYNDDYVYSYFSYDPHGNVKWLVQDIPGLGKSYVRYEYDLISNKVLAVHYNEGRADQFHQYYEYDADNRITKVYTSRETQTVTSTRTENDRGKGTSVKGKFSGVVATKEAHYDYFKHGPLKRTELGNDNIQGTDYTYTIHGWLKAMNHPSLVATDDAGLDGNGSSTFGKDVFGMALGYYKDDFKHGIGSPFDSRNSKIITSDTLAQNPLYNGNISSWTTNTYDGNPYHNAGLTGNIYRYDYLNRIVGADFTRYVGSDWTTSTTDYDESFSYDGNGNIINLTRNGTTTAMDDFTYNYISGTNKLNYVADAVSSGNYPTDIDNQSTGNYKYSAIGNLTRDEADGIDTIYWTVYGKVSEVYKDNGDTLFFKYSPSGQRISKEVRRTSGVAVTYYSRDASGNVLSIYERTTQGDSLYVFKQMEIPIYGSDRISTYSDSLKILTTNLDGDPIAFPCWCPNGTTVATYYYTDLHLMDGEGAVYSRSLFKRKYELKDHLNSVRALAYDRKDSTNNAELSSYTNTYAFGMERDALNPNKSRYGMNGQEKETEVGEGIYTAEFWEYDSRTGRRWNMDPKPITGISDYACFMNNPILFSDLLGDTIVIAGNRAQEFLTKLNQESSVQFKINEKNQLVLANPDEEITGEFAIKMTQAINNAQTITFKTVEKNDGIFFDSFESGEVDVDDFNNVDGTLYKAQLLHFTAERFAMEDYEKNKGSITDKEFKKYHTAGLNAEIDFYKEVYPEKGDIRYLGEGLDKTTLTHNADGTGTINYISNFNDVQKVFVQPVSSDGTTLETVVPGKSEVKTKK